MAEVEERSRTLATHIRETFLPEIVVFVAKGGFVAGRAIAEEMKAPLYEISAERRQAEKKIAPVFRLLPQRFRFWMIDLEMNLGIHRKASARNIIVPKALQELSDRQSRNLERVLVVDDSVDTGITADAVKRKVQELFPDADVRFAALSMIWISERMFRPDYFLYKDTIIKTGTSKDSPEHERFLKEYDEWKRWDGNSSLG